MVQRVFIKEEILLWAIEESQLPLEKIKAKFPSIDSWIDHSKDPTFQQLKSFADFLMFRLDICFLMSLQKRSFFMPNSER